MKKIKLAFAALAVAVAVISCGGKKEGGSESSAAGNSLDGTWEIVKAEGTMADLNKGTNYIFEGNNITMAAGIIKTPGTYTISGDTIIMKLEGGMEMKFTHSFVNDQLVTKVIGSDQVFYMDKK